MQDAVNTPKPMNRSISNYPNSAPLTHYRNMYVGNDSEFVVNYSEKLRTEHPYDMFPIGNRLIARDEQPQFLSGDCGFDGRVVNTLTHRLTSFSTAMNHIDLPYYKTNGLSGLILDAWKTDTIPTLEPYTMMMLALNIMTKHIERENIQGVFSGAGRQVEISVQLQGFNLQRFTQSIAEGINSKLTQEAKNHLAPLFGAIEYYKQKNPIVSTGLNVSMMGAMKKDFSYSLTRCSMVGIAMSTDNEGWRMFFDICSGISRLIPSLEPRMTLMISIIRSWIGCQFDECIFNVASCGSGHVDIVSGQFVELLCGKWETKITDFESETCYAFAPWSDKTGNREEKNICVSGIDRFVLVRELGIIIPSVTVANYIERH